MDDVEGFFAIANDRLWARWHERIHRCVDLNVELAMHVHIDITGSDTQIGMFNEYEALLEKINR